MAFRLFSVCRKVGTDASYIDMFMGCPVWCQVRRVDV
jgi:hypothetical protein